MKNVLIRIKIYWFANSENIFACSMAILAAFLAINDLVAGRYGDDEIILTNEKNNAFLWYQSKSIKEYIVKGQVDTLNTLIEAKAIREEDALSFKKQTEELSRNIERYKKEKQEILLGSAAVGKDNWVQDIDGEFGKVAGAKEIEKDLQRLSRAGDRFDISSLFFQLSLVMGALGILVKKMRVKNYALFAMMMLGALGVGFSMRGLLIIYS